jgi:DNA-binding NarL/FixJ family response regulator
MKKIIIADDHPMIRGALALSLAATSAFGKIEVIETAALDELVQLLESGGDADLVLLDLRMPGVNGFDGLITLRSRFPATPVVIISALEEPRLVAGALALGAAGFIPKSTPRHEIVRALNLVAAGEIYAPPDLPQAPPADNVDSVFAQRLTSLTPQQRKVLQLMGTGKLNKEIAYELAIAETTVKAHVSSILHKLNVYSRTQAVVMAGRLHLNGFANIAEI